ncbi:cytochrome b5 domain-containing protein [Limosilactobacillus reuteri]|uniref:Cytochrome B5 n=1 Tax=Limosilactobacillus reuteri TaxID=1598 RepID=A0AAW9A2F4_LIMRT|nr:cytochrome b5 domain-containing protein [Limosilactobacillus reuteri]MDV8947154.1 cytochrome B5 [Limosilactobacillus reuteri]
MAKTFTREELKKYDGQNGNPAYVAINNRVYDVTHIPAWQDGTHHGNKAGLDLTDVLFNYSPHKDRVLAKLPLIGQLV